MGNQQLYDLNPDVLQVLLSGYMGDGSFRDTGSDSATFITNCIHKDYIDFKASILRQNFKIHESNQINRGFKANIIYRLYVNSNPIFYYISRMNIQDVMNTMNDLGLALWIYDDGTKHKDKDFYQLSTHSFSKEVQEDILIPILKAKWGINAKCISEKKKDGRIFWYLSISKYEGAFEITNILSKYRIESFTYKLWSSTTIQKWSKFQEELKSKDITSYSKESLPMVYANIWRKINKEVI